jgi:hypothetical protein
VRGHQARTAGQHQPKGKRHCCLLLGIVASRGGLECMVIGLSAASRGCRQKRP